MDRRQRPIRFTLGAEEDRLLDLRRAGEAGEGMIAGGGREHRPRVGKGFEGADQQRPLPVEEAYRPLPMYPPSHRSARRKVMLVVTHWPYSQPVYSASDNLVKLTNQYPNKWLGSRRFAAQGDQGRAGSRGGEAAQLVGGEDLVEFLPGQ